MVGLVLVGHSADVVRGTLAMVRQAAPAVPADGAGGLSGGRLGTSAPGVRSALRRVLDATAGDDVLVLLDLGSAALALEVALDDLDEPSRARIHVSEAPFVEGAVLGAVAASTGDPVAVVAAAAARAATTGKLAGEDR